jgi:hypothetical protein
MRIQKIASSCLISLAMACAPQQTLVQDLDISSTGRHLSGCYELQFNAQSDEKSFAAIERRVWLTTLELTASGTAASANVVRPAPGERASAFEAVYWQSSGTEGGVVITRSTGYNGISLKLNWAGSASDLLHGEARTFSDQIGLDTELAAVTATPIRCYR